MTVPFLFSVEEECLTARPGNPADLGEAIGRFFSIHRGLAPSVPGGAGYFNAYGRVYVDMDHIELAAMECDDPYLLSIVVDQQHQLAQRTLDALRAEGIEMILANNNHDGLLRSGCAVWGAHENYLTENHPSTFTQQILPFLVTRLYAGAGGIHYPSGNFLAAVRPICMTLATGGGTTSRRAIHSTAREEHHMGGCDYFRYHQILGDGHRCQFNLALQFGATALALKAAMFDEQLPEQLAALKRFPPSGGNWVRLLQRLNLLARPGKPLKIDPLVSKTQRVYLSAAERYVSTLEIAPDWVTRTLQDWSDTLAAQERMDVDWLAARFDSFAKYKLYTNVLEQSGHSWRQLRGRTDLFSTLALLDHSYHEFANPSSVFNQLDAAELLAHRVADPVAPGSEPEPFVPATRSRARARARFISERRNDPRLYMDWSCVHDRDAGDVHTLYDPFAQQYQHARDREALAPRGGSLARMQVDLRRALEDL